MTNAERLTQINVLICRRDTTMQINRIIKELCADCFAEGVIKGKEITLRDQKHDAAQRKAKR